MIKINTFLQIVLYLVACIAFSTDEQCYSETCSQTSGKDSECEKGSKWRESMESLNDLHSKLADFPDTRKRLNEVKASLEDLNDKNRFKSTPFKIPLEKVNKLLRITLNSTEKLKSGRPLNVLQGVLEIVSGFTNLLDAGRHSHTLILQTLSAVGVLFTETNKLNQTSVMHQLTNIVQSDMVNVNNRVHGQKFQWLQHRLTEQISQLHQLKEREKLDDPTLWNDYAQFLFELAFRFEAPLTFRYTEDNLGDDPDVKDFVTAVVQYSEAHSFFVALLFVAKAKYVELRTTHEEDEIATVDRKLMHQIKEAKKKLSFLSEKRFLTFLGRVEGGKLTKILVLSRRVRDRSLVETVRHSLGLSPMPDLSTVEFSAKRVNQQEVTLRSVEKCKSSSAKSLIRFINDADFPIKIFSGEVGRFINKSVFQKLLLPHESYTHVSPCLFSSGGYIVFYLNGNMLNSDFENTRIIEFAMSNIGPYLINIQDRTGAEFLRGQNAYNDLEWFFKLVSKPVTLYFSENGKYYIARAEISVCFRQDYAAFRFTIQDFDPEAVGD